MESVCSTLDGSSLLVHEDVPVAGVISDPIFPNKRLTLISQSLLGVAFKINFNILIDDVECAYAGVEAPQPSRNTVHSLS